MIAYHKCRDATIGIIVAMLCLAPGLLGAEPSIAKSEENGKIDKPPATLKPRPSRVATDDMIREQLGILFQWSSSQQYTYYFIWLPRKVGMLNAVNNHYQDMVGGKTYLFNPYGSLPGTPATTGSIRFTVPDGLKDLAEKNNGICVQLDGFTDPVPVIAAEEFAASFANGFATRLILGQFSRQWSAGNEAKKINLDIMQPGSNAMLPIPKEFVAAESYKAGDFQANLGALLQKNNLQATGILYGWKAASELDALYGGGDEKYWKAAWNLLRYRFDSAQLGEITGHTLNYLVGFSKTNAVRRAADARQDKEKAGATSDPGVLLSRLAEDNGVKEAKLLLTQLHDMFLIEFRLIAANSKIPDVNRSALLGEYFSFISGFERGASKAADQVFEDVFGLGYGLGYKDGFRDGYAQGYAAGYRDGYAVGYKNAWEEANKVILSLQKQVGELTSKNQELERKLAGAGDGGNWVDDAVKIVGAVGTAIGIIASFF